MWRSRLCLNLGSTLKVKPFHKDGVSTLYARIDAGWRSYSLKNSLYSFSFAPHLSHYKNNHGYTLSNARCAQASPNIKVQEDAPTCSSATVSLNPCKKPGQSLLSRLQSLINENNMDEASQLLLREKFENAYPFNLVIQAFCNQSNLKKALQIFEEMKQSNTAPDTCTYNILIHAHRFPIYFHSAFDFAQEMKQRNVPLDTITYNSLIHSHIAEKNMDSAYDMLETMKTTGISPNEITYNTILSAEWRIEKIRDIFQEMEKLNIAPSDFTYTCVLTSLLKSDQPEYCFDFLSEMRRKGISPKAPFYISLLNYFSLEGEERAMQEIFCNIPDFAMEAYSIMLKGLFKQNKPIAAQMFFEKACAGGNTSVHLFNIAMNEVYSPYVSLEFFKRMKTLNIAPNQESYCIILNRLCRIRRRSECLPILFEFAASNLATDLISFNIMLKAAATFGQFKKAQQYFSKMEEKEIKPDAYSYSQMIFSLSKVEKLKENNHEAKMHDKAIEWTKRYLVSPATWFPSVFFNLQRAIPPEMYVSFLEQHSALILKKADGNMGAFKKILLDDDNNGKTKKDPARK